MPGFASVADLQTSGAPTLVAATEQRRPRFQDNQKHPGEADRPAMMAMATAAVLWPRVLSIDSRGIDMPLHTPAVVPLQVAKTARRDLRPLGAPCSVAMISIMRRTLSLTRP